MIVLSFVLILAGTLLYFPDDWQVADAFTRCGTWRTPSLDASAWYPPLKAVYACEADFAKPRTYKFASIEGTVHYYTGLI